MSLHNEEGGNQQQPATDDAIDKLKVIKVKDKHYEENKTGEMEPPTCTICTGEMEKRAVKLPCKHLFHKKCISKWLKIHHACPICRKEVD